MTINKHLALVTWSVLLLALASSSCVAPSGDTVQEQRASAEANKKEALAAIYADKPKAEKAVEASVGYAVFNNFGIHAGILSLAHGYGVLVNKQTGKETYLKWNRLTIGPGIAVKGLYSLFVINDPEVLKKVEKGPWVMGGQAEASFVFGDFGGGAEAAWMFKKGASVYYTTHTGVALELELFGVGKLGRNDELNEAPAP